MLRMGHIRHGLAHLVRDVARGLTMIIRAGSLRRCLAVRAHRTRGTKLLGIGAIPALLALIAVALGAVLTRSSTCAGRHAETEIFTGITYGCEQLTSTAEGEGIFHWVRVDLMAPGIEVFVTPLNATAMAHGWQYRLRRVGEVVDREHLA